MGHILKISTVSLLLLLMTAAVMAAPVISNVQVSRVYGTTATVTWTTNTASTSRVTYGTSIPPGIINSDSTMVTSHSITLTGLTTCSNYYFSVMSTDGGGSTTDNNGGLYYTFETGLNSQLSYSASTGLPATIPVYVDPDPGVVTSTISVSDTKPIEDVNVTISHSGSNSGIDFDSVFFLSVYLVAPDSTIIPLSLRNGLDTDSDYIDTVFDDEAADYIGDPSQSPPYTGSFKPNGQLSHLYGMSPNGTWTLRIENYSDTNTGTLYAWSISFTDAYQYCDDHLALVDYAVTDNCTGTGYGDGNGVVDPGEDIVLDLTLHNDGNANQTGISGTISTSTPGVTISDSSASFSNIAIFGNGTSQGNDFAFNVAVADDVCGDNIEIDAHITSTQDTSGWTHAFTIPIGTPRATSGTVLDEDFTFGIPGTWTIVNGGTPTGSTTWSSPAPCPDPYNERYPPLNDPYAEIDGYCAGSGETQDDQLITPVLNLSTASGVTLQFDQGFYYWDDPTYYEIGDVDVRSSLTSGAWTNVLRNDHLACPSDCVDSPSIDISSQAAGAANVQVRFRYYNASYDFGWIVDNVKVTYTADPYCEMDACCPLMTTPSIGTISDLNLCSQSGVSIPFTSSTPATRHDLYVDGTLKLSGVTSPVSYNPGDLVSHDYKIRAVNGLEVCYIESSVKSFTDQNQTPSTPSITNITDDDACAQSGIKIYYTAGTPATSTVLVRDSVEVATMTGSPYSYNPGNTTSHTYIVRTYNNTCHKDSSSQAFSDANNKPGAPTIGTITDSSGACAYGLSIPFTSGSGATSHDFYVDTVLTQSSVSSPVSYTPSNTSSHTYVIRAKKSTCYTDSPGSAFSDVNDKPGAPTIGTITDSSGACAYGLSIPFTSGSGATSHDFYVDTVLTQSGVTSPVSYTPANTSSHTYVIRAKKNTCYTDSPGSAFSDVNDKPGQPVIGTITDSSGSCAYGLTIPFTSGSGATSHDFYVDTVLTQSGVTSPVSYTPANTSSHTYVIRAKKNTCYTDSPGSPFSDVNDKPGAPTIGTITDSSGACAYGISIPFTGGSGATSHDFYVDGALNQSGVSSPVSYTPANTSSHSYVIRAVNGSCNTDSPAKVFSDTNNKPGAPVVTAVNDVSACAQSGVQVVFTGGSGATSHDLYRDGTSVVTGYVSGSTYVPGDTTSHSYVVRAVNGTCWTDSNSLSGSDADGTPSAPAISSVTDVNGCALSGVTVTFTSGSPATQHDLYVDGSLKQTGITSPYVYSPGNTSSHDYIVRAVNGTCHTDSNTISCTDVNTAPSAPSISSVADLSACAQTGVTVTFTTGSPATQHDLYVDGVLAQANVTSPYLYNPGNTSSHAYMVRAVNGACNTDSNVVDKADINNKPSQPVITSIVDNDPNALTGVTINYTAGSPATQHDLLVDGGSVVVTNFISGSTYTPGDSNQHWYQIKAINGACLNFSSLVAGIDAECSDPGAPSITGITDVSACATSGIKIAYTAGSGATSHNLYRDGTLVVTGYASSATYTPGDNSSHSYIIRALDGACFTDSPSQAGTDTNSSPSAPVIVGISDGSACTQAGLTITFTTGSPATQHDLYVDGVLAQANVTSPYLYNPGNTSSHAYMVRAVNGTCNTDSNVVDKADINNKPSQPVITSIVDNDPTVLTGVTINYTAGSPATQHDLLVDGGSVVVTNFISGSTYTPGDSNQHWFQIKAINGTCLNFSSLVAGIDAQCSNPGTPSITGITDVSVCATSGIKIAYTAGSGATSHDLYRDGTLVVTGYASSATYTPGDNSSHNYTIRAKSGACFTDSSSQAGTDADGTPSAPTLISVVDNSGTVCDGVVVTFTAGSPATQTDLWRDGAQVATNITSPHLYVPGDSSSHNYVVRTYNGSCYTDSGSLAATDACISCVAPTDRVVETVNTDKTGFKWTDISGADFYRVVRALRADLATYNFTGCVQYGIASGATGVNISSEDPSGAAGRCFYYIVQGYDCSDPDEFLGPAGDGVVTRSLAATTCDGD